MLQGHGDSGAHKRRRKVRWRGGVLGPRVLTGSATAALAGVGEEEEGSAAAAAVADAGEDDEGARRGAAGTGSRVRFGFDLVRATEPSVPAWSAALSAKKMLRGRAVPSRRAHLAATEKKKGRKCWALLGRALRRTGPDGISSA